MKYITDNEIVITDKETALKIAELLLSEEYCVMMSREEDLYIINYEWSRYSDRNEMVFLSREEFENELSKNDEDIK